METERWVGISKEEGSRSCLLCATHSFIRMLIPYTCINIHQMLYVSQGRH